MTGAIVDDRGAQCEYVDAPGELTAPARTVPPRRPDSCRPQVRSGAGQGSSLLDRVRCRRHPNGSVGRGSRRRYG